MNKKIIIIIAAVLLLALAGTSAFIFYKQSLFKKDSAKIQIEESPVAEAPKDDPALFDLTLSKIFDAHQDTSKLDPKEITTIIATGDVIPARTTNYKVVSSGDFTLPYLKTADILKGGDITIANFEAPLVTGCAKTTTGMSFCGDPRNVQGLVYAGVDIASVANNHSGNKGAKGLAESSSILKANNIEPVGYGDIAVKEIKGIKYAFLGYNGVGPSFDMAKIKAEIAEAKKTADVVIVMPHWGKEYVRTPAASPGIAPDDPKVVSHAMIDAGADLIIGNHPHWYQGVEIYKNKLITYAHGNFVFDQDWSVETMEGVVGKYTFYKGKLVDVTFSPVKIENLNQPYFLVKEVADKILGIMKASSWVTTK